MIEWHLVYIQFIVVARPVNLHDFVSEWCHISWICSDKPLKTGLEPYLFKACYLGSDQQQLYSRHKPIYGQQQWRAAENVT